MKWWHQGSLFRQTSLVLILAFLLFLSVSFIVAGVLLVLPMAKRSADDLAALIVLSVQTWNELPPDTRPDFVHEIQVQHGLTLQPSKGEIADGGHTIPYLHLLEAALSRRLPSPAHVKITYEPEIWFWVDIPASGHLLRIGFPHQRLGTHAMQAFLLALACGVVLAIITAFLLARYLARPLETLARATIPVGHGHLPEPLPETGPQELVMLAHGFNRMSHEVRELLDNRTTLLAGLSHDLRTPMTRLRVICDLLPENTPEKLRIQIARDIEDMNRLTANFLELARGLEHETQTELELVGELAAIAEGACTAGGKVVFSHDAGKLKMKASRSSLLRIVNNLLDNALRYGQGKPVRLVLEPDTSHIGIAVIDQGPGIPLSEREAVFRPFYRLEGSRSQQTGGSGLGLAIARQLASTYGWTIRIEDAPKGGTAVRLVLPRP